MSLSRNQILLVDERPDTRRNLRAALSGLGFQIFEAGGGEEALSLVRARHFDAVLLGMNMAGIGGLETCRRIRQLSTRIPILVTTINVTPQDTATALDAGADYSLTKPFNLRELIACLRASIRRSQFSEREETEAVMKIGEIELDPERRLLLKTGRSIHLTPKEFDLLRFLMSHAGKPLSHERLLQAVWGIEYRGQLEYLRTFVRQLRKKIEDDPAKPQYLLTDPHIGYRFAEKL